MSILQQGTVYEVMRLSNGKNGSHNGHLGMARADIVNGQEVLVSSYDWNTKKPLTFTPIPQARLTGKIFTDAELASTGFGKLFGPNARK